MKKWWIVLIAVLAIAAAAVVGYMLSTAPRGVERLHRQCAQLIVVSNEVFRGGADYAGDTARYLLALARVNNAVAARADHVCRVVCGLPRWVKGGDEFGRA